MYRCKSGTIKNAECRIIWIVVLEKTVESPLDCKEINPKENWPWTFIERTVAKAEVLYFGYMMQRVNSLKKTLMLGKTEGKKEKRVAEDEMIR